MSLKKELIFGKGYSVFTIDNMRLFKRLRSKVLKRMNILSMDSKVNEVRKPCKNFKNN